jgi:16S rRNA U1498 N3-methylase RsmE
MSIHRFYLAPDQWTSENPALGPENSHHCADVLRLSVGDALTIFDGEGSVADAVLTEVHRKHCRVRIGERTITPPLRAAITLAQAVPKGKNMDLILRQPRESLLLLASLQPGAMSIKQALANAPAHSMVTVMVGPEGDFTPEESTVALAAGAFPVTLGPLILRAETAELNCLCVLGNELSEHSRAGV